MELNLRLKNFHLHKILPKRVLKISQITNLKMKKALLHLLKTKLLEQNVPYSMALYLKF